MRAARLPRRVSAPSVPRQHSSPRPRSVSPSSLALLGGLNLSGGQKARVALARACYADAAIYVLDDVLSAVDRHVARHLVDECLVGYLKGRGKAVILATHQALGFSASDRFLLMKEGRVAFDGTYEDAQASASFSDQVLGLSASTLTSATNSANDAGAPVDADDANTISDCDALDQAKDVEGELKKEMPNEPKGKETDDSKTIPACDALDKAKDDKVEPKEERPEDPKAKETEDPKIIPDCNALEKAKEDKVETQKERPKNQKAKEAEDSLANTVREGANLTGKEEKKTGAVSVGTYMDYAHMVGGGISLAIIFFVTAVNVQTVLSNWWLSRWTDAVDDPDFRMAYHVGGYAGFGLSGCVCVFLFRILFVYGGLQASAKVHQRMVSAILGAPQAFFDTTLTGRLLNLFTSDMKAIDEEVVTQLSDLFNFIFMLLSVVILVVVVIPISLVPLVPLFMVYFFIQKTYRSTSRELKRFDSTTQSPIFNHFAETSAGLSTIRAFRCEERALGETQARIDHNTKFWVANNSANRWLGMRLDAVGAGLSGFTGLACVVTIHMGTRIDPGLVGLVLSYVTLFTGLLNWGERAGRVIIVDNTHVNCTHHHSLCY